MREPQTALATVSNRRGIQSVETGLRVLASLAAGRGPQSLSVIGGRAGISPSQTHRYLQSLMAAGMAVQDAAQRYDLGPAAIAIGIAALARQDVFASAEAAMTRFVAETGRSAAISVWSESGVVVVRWLGGTPPIFSPITVGTVLPVRHSAAGHVFLTFLRPEETRDVEARERASDHAVVTVDVGAIRRRLLADLHSAGQPLLTPGLRTMAAPVFDLQGRLALAITAVATAGFDPDEDEAVAARLLAACEDATSAVGGTWPRPG